MKKIIVLFLCLFVVTLTSCNCKGCKKKEVLIYTSNEDFRIETMEKIFKEELPDIKVVIQYYPTGTMASKIKAEGKDTSADIFVGLEVGYAENMKEYFADLSSYDTSVFLDEILPNHNKYHIWSKEAGSIIINNKILRENNLPKPTSYQDLLDSRYKNLVMMPNPKTSGTGYYFYSNLYSAWGEQAALNYFESLNGIVKQFSESGSGPVKSLDKGEIAIGLGMTFQAITYVNANPDLEITYFEEGSPYSLYAMGIINGKEKNEDVKKVYDVLFNKITPEDKKLHNPEQIYKNQVVSVIPNYPKDVKYAKMEGMFDPSHKDALIAKWKW